MEPQLRAIAASHAAHAAMVPRGGQQDHRGSSLRHVTIERIPSVWIKVVPDKRIDEDVEPSARRGFIDDGSAPDYLAYQQRPLEPDLRAPDIVDCCGIEQADTPR